MGKGSKVRRRWARIGGGFNGPRLRFDLRPKTAPFQINFAGKVLRFAQLAQRRYPRGPF